MGIVAGKIIVGAIKPVKTRSEEPVKSFAEVRPAIIEDETTPIPVDKRFSSYFVVNKESDYLDHNIRNNRR